MLNFRNLEYVTWPLSPCYSASVCTSVLWRCKPKTELNWTGLNWILHEEDCELGLHIRIRIRTELNWIVQLSSVQFSAVHWTGDELRRPSPVFIQWQTLHWLNDSRECASIVKKLRRPPISSPNRRVSSQVVTGSMQRGKLNWTVQLSWVQFAAVYLATVALVAAVNYKTKIRLIRIY